MIKNSSSLPDADDGNVCIHLPQWCECKCVNMRNEWESVFSDRCFVFVYECAFTLMQVSGRQRYHQRQSCIIKCLQVNEALWD